jgi:hypothetical protein
MAGWPGGGERTGGILRMFMSYGVRHGKRRIYTYSEKSYGRFASLGLASFTSSGFHRLSLEHDFCFSMKHIHSSMKISL